MTKKTEKRAATKKEPKAKKEPKMTETEQAEVKEQQGALIADATTPADTTVPATAETKKEPKAKPDRHGKSSVASPVAIVHEIVKENPTWARKQVIEECAKRGIAYHTATTQFYRAKKALAAK